AVAAAEERRHGPLLLVGVGALDGPDGAVPRDHLERRHGPTVRRPRRAERAGQARGLRELSTGVAARPGIPRLPRAPARPRPLPQPLSFTCPRCGREATADWYGPCEACRADLRARIAGEARAVDLGEYEPKMNV